MPASGMTRAFALAVCTAFACGILPVSAEAPPAKSLPNVVVFFIDDMGYGDLGPYGAPTTSTPNIDQMASEGAVLTQWYSAHPICTPSRAAMLTGRLPVRYGLACTGNGGQAVFGCGAVHGLPENETTMAEALQEKGFATLMVGKWHLGQQDKFLPAAHGFDDYFGVPYSVDMGFAYNNRTSESEFEGKWYGCNPLALVRGTKILEQPADLNNLTMRYTALVEKFVRQQATARKPFFVYYAFNHVHTPQYAAPESCGTSERGIFGDSVEEVDRGVGAVLDLLRELAPNTLVLLTSDNGAPDAAQHNPPDLSPAPIVGSNGPFLGAKTETWEGGLREPGIVWWPGKISPQRSSAQASTLDVFATVAEAAGLTLPSVTMDSVSLLPLLTKRNMTKPRETQFFYRGCTLAAMRHKQWKVHFDTTKPTVFGQDTSRYEPYGPQDPPLLFHIEHDPSERFPVINKTDVLAEISAVVQQHRAEMGQIPRGVLGDSDPSLMLCCDKTSTPPCTCTAPPSLNMI